MELRITKSYGTDRIYGTVYPQEVLGLGFNTRWGGYYAAISK